MRILIFFLALVFLGSCKSLQAPEFKGGESVKLDKVDGNTIKFTAGANIYNGNWFGLRVKPSEFELYIEDEYVGKVSLDKKVKLKRKRETFVEAPFTANLEKGVMFKMLRYAAKDQVKIRLKGKAKGGVFIFSKKIDIDQTKTISGKSLKFGS